MRLNYRARLFSFQAVRSVIKPIESHMHFNFRAYALYSGARYARIPAVVPIFIAHSSAPVQFNQDHKPHLKTLRLLYIGHKWQILCGYYNRFCARHVNHGCKNVARTDYKAGGAFKVAEMKWNLYCVMGRFILFGEWEIGYCMFHLP